jgi:hypothetical protein
MGFRVGSIFPAARCDRTTVGGGGIGVAANSTGLVRAAWKMNLQDGLAEAANVLAMHCLDYALIDGLATSYRSQSCFTKDLDFLLGIPQLILPIVPANLAERGFDFDTQVMIREWSQHHMAVLSFRGIRIDLLKPIPPAYQHVLDRSTNESWLGQPIRIATAEGLILLKLFAFRTQDQLDIENLVAANREALDTDWLRAEWQSVASLDDARMQRLMELTSR